MGEPFNAIKITDRIYWVGAIDWSLREFHGYATDRGTTYNAYLIMAEKPTLIDTVKRPFCDEMFSRIASVMDPKDIVYIVSNHAELDHSGSLPEAVARIQPEKVFASSKGVDNLNLHFHGQFEPTAVRENAPLSLGNATLQFVETRMLHWPDSMFTYLVEDEVLFTQDGFGMHLASSERFDDQIDASILEHEAKKYYANIVLPFAPMVNSALKKAASLKIKMVAPDHGPIWRKDMAKVIGWYAKWAAQQFDNKAVIIYDTMWESTAAMAAAVEDGLVSDGAIVKSMRLRENHRSHVATEILDAGAIVVGSPTMNNHLYPTVADVLTYIRGLRPKNRIGATFGSYGWGGEAAKLAADVLTDMRVELVAEPLRVQFVPDKAALVQCRDLGRLVAGRLRQKVAEAQFGS